MNLGKRLADNLVAVRTNLGLTQEDFAKISKINRTTIGNIENYRTSVSIDILEKLSKSLDTDPCLLLARNTLVIPKTKIKPLQLIPTLLKKGEAAFAFWTEEGMEFHPLSKNSTRTSITMMALLQANGFSGEDLFKNAKKLHIPYLDRFIK